MKKTIKILVLTITIFLAVTGRVYADESSTEKCTITFDANGGNISVTTKEVNKGDAAGVLPQPSKENCYFGGWYTAKDGGSSFSATTSVTEDVKLYAHWQCNDNFNPDDFNADDFEADDFNMEYTVTFDPNGGYVYPASFKGKAGTAIEFPTPTREGYIFDAWYTQKENGTKVAKDAEIVNNVTYYAHWIKIAAEGGKETEEIPQTPKTGNAIVYVVFMLIACSAGYSVYYFKAKKETK